MDLRDVTLREQFLAQLPHAPGVYVMRNAAGQVLYVGKAVDLHGRVHSYFRPSGDDRHFIPRLPSEMADLEIWVTSSEREALLLENNLIKELRPRYNVLLRDDKSYLMVRLDATHTWPRFETVRGLPKDDGARWFGPYHSSSAVRFVLSFIGKYFCFRTCSDAVFVSRKKPCLQFHIRRCEAPCTRSVDREAYLKRLQKATLYLEGKLRVLMRDVRREMKQAAEDLEFERAAQLRDLLFSLEKLSEPQHVVTTDFVATDAVGFVREDAFVSLVVLEVRAGSVSAHRQMVEEFPPGLFDEDILSSFLTQHYLSRSRVPARILVPFEPSSAGPLMSVLSDLAEDGTVEFVIPGEDKSRRLLQLAQTNARHRLTLQTELEVERDLGRLASRLHLPAPPGRMECYDISHLQGKDPVASMVVFTGGRPTKKSYRQFHLQTVVPGDDYGALREVITRRLARASEQGWELPDLMVIDGGRGQLHAVMQVLAEKGCDPRVHVVALAKMHGADGPPERVFLPNVKDPLPVPGSGRELFLLVRMRDEAHRFARKAQYRRREKTFHSRLEQVPGVGHKRCAFLLRTFGSLEGIRSAGLEELAKKGKISLKLAETILDFLKEIPS